MARKIYYKVYENGLNRISDAEWDDVLRLQHWYNSEFTWTAGKLLFKMFVVFPNPEFEPDEERLLKTIIERRSQLRQDGMPDNQIIHTMLAEGMVIARKGGYFDECIASGFTRVAGNEWNALLVVEFLIKSSISMPSCIIDVHDDGTFIKTRHIRMNNGSVEVVKGPAVRGTTCEELVRQRRVFSIVDPAKYDNFPAYQSHVQGFGEMNAAERLSIASDVSWLGFDSNYDLDGDDIQGVNLNLKVAAFGLAPS